MCFRSGLPDRTLGAGELQQQHVGTLPLAQQRDDVLPAPLVGEQLGIGGEQVLVGIVELERGAVMGFRGGAGSPMRRAISASTVCVHCLSVGRAPGSALSCAESVS